MKARTPQTAPVMGPKLELERCVVDADVDAEEGVDTGEGIGVEEGPRAVVGEGPKTV
jgi:hypothetical protein